MPVRTEPPREPEAAHPARRTEAACSIEPQRPVPLVAFLIGALLLALTVAPFPAGSASSSLRVFLLAAAGIALLALGWLELIPPVPRCVFPRPLALTVGGFFGWALLSFFLTPFPAYGAIGVLQLAGGLLLALGVARTESDAERSALTFVPVLLSGALSLSGLWMAGSTGSRLLGGMLQDEQMLGAILAVLLPFSLVSAVRGHRSWRRMGGQAALMLSLVMLAVTQNRSSWVAAGAGALTLLLLELPGMTRRRHRPVHRPRNLMVPAVVALTLVVGTLSLPAFRPLVGLSSQRASTLGAVDTDESYQWRRRAWDVALRMLRARPVLGWGLGAYPIRQALFNDSTRTQAEILATGPGLSESAHNTYLQLGAELGIPGLLLYLGVVVTFLYECARGRARARGSARAWLSAILAGVVAQGVSGIASPAWEYPECSAVFWLLIGLGIVLARSGGRVEEESHAV